MIDISDMKGYALVVGVNIYSSEHYDLANVSSLNSSKLSAKKFYEKIEQLKDYELNKERDMLVGKRATATNFLNRLSAFVDISRKEKAHFLIYYSGHGYNVPNRNDKDHFFLFYEKMLFDREITTQINKINSESTTTIVFDSCFSEGLFESLKAKEQPFSFIEGNKKKQEYWLKLEKLRGGNDYKENTAFYFSASENELTHIGNDCEIAPFTRDFIEICFDNHYKGNFYQLDKCIKARPNFNLHTYLKALKDEKRFLENVPIKINQIVNLKFKCKMTYLIEIDDENKKSDDHVTGYISRVGDENYEFSGTHFIEKSDLEDELDELYDERFEFGMKIYVEQNSSGSNYFEITSANSVLKYDGDPDFNDVNGVIYIYNMNTSKVVKHKPIRGSVKNGSGIG